MSAIIYIHLKTFFKIIYLNCIKHFSVKRFLATLLFLLAFGIINTLLFLFRLLDEILFFGYRKTDISRPVFIVSNPRSGTTYMHRLLCLDEERYVYMLLYHTIISSITFYKLINGISWLDKRIGRPFRRLFDWIDSWFFKGWQNIHPTGFNQSEEDEGIYVFPLLTIAICLICPYMQEFKYLTLVDTMPDKQRQRIRNYYRSSMKRFMYSEGKDKTLLSKNVITTGRLNTILDIFPDARIVYLIRDPKKAVPSFISMFSATWKLIAPKLPENGPEYRALGQIAIDFYTYFHENKKRFKAENFLVVPYTKLVADPMQTVRDIYAHFNMPLSPIFEKALIKETSKTRKYRSKHSYSLAQYGFSASEIETQLGEVIQTYNLNPTKNLSAP